MPTFRRVTPYLVDARRWNQNYPESVPEVMPGYGRMGPRGPVHPAAVVGDCGKPIFVYDGDWVLTHEDGRLTVMSDEEFRSTYEVVVDWKLERELENATLDWPKHLSCLEDLLRSLEKED